MVLTILDIDTGDENRQQTGHSHRAEKLSVRMVWTQGQGTLAQMGESLSQPHTKQVVGVLGMVNGKLSQHGRQASIIGS